MSSSDLKTLGATVEAALLSTNLPAPLDLQTAGLVSGAAIMPLLQQLTAQLAKIEEAILLLVDAVQSPQPQNFAGRANIQHFIAESMASGAATPPASPPASPIQAGLTVTSSSDLPPGDSTIAQTLAGGS